MAAFRGEKAVAWQLTERGVGLDKDFHGKILRPFSTPFTFQKVGLWPAFFFPKFINRYEQRNFIRPRVHGEREGDQSSRHDRRDRERD